MDTFKTSRQLYINMHPKDIPKWDYNKPYYWEQSKTVLDFWLNEYDKVCNGLWLGNYFMTGWMYFHLNFFKTEVMDSKTNKVLLTNPPLNDNTYFLMECYKEAEKLGQGFCMWGTRGFNKSTYLASHEAYTHTISEGIGGTSMIVYGSGADLTSIQNIFTNSNDICHPAFKLNSLTGKGDWGGTKGVISFGVEQQNGEQIKTSHIKLINAEKGTGKSSEKSAGLTPIGYKMDEIGKYDPRGIFNAAQVSFKREGISNFVFILAGTGGNSDLSEGAKEMLTKPSDYNLYVMNWELLNNMVPDEHITWKEDINKKFCIFVPGHMSYRDNAKKIDKSFKELTKGKYDNEELNSMNVKSTDWGEANKFFYDKYNSLESQDKKNTLRMQLPRNIDDTFLVDKINSFDKDRIVRKLSEIKSKPKYNLVDIDIDPHTSKIIKKFSGDKELAGRQYEGKPIDAPIMIFEGFPEEIPPMFQNVAGSDDYKSDEATTKSLGSMYVLQRRTLNQPLERIIACVTERPKRHRDLYSKWEKLLRSTGALNNLEIADASFITYLEDVIKVNPYDYLCKYMNPYEQVNHKKQTTNNKYRFGTYPHQWNKKHLMELVIRYTQEEIPVGYDENGNQIIITGIDLIEDPWLLQEMLDYEVGGNYDRIISFGWALVLARHYDKLEIKPKDPFLEKYREDFVNKPKTKVLGITSTKGIRKF